MKIFSLFCLISLVLSQGPLSYEFYEDLKKKADYELIPLEENPFRDFTLEELKEMLGNIEPSPNVTYTNTESNLNLPTTYDFRKTYTNCVFTARYQGNCASCVAFSATLTLQMRRCRAGKGKTILSPQDIVSCETTYGYCNGTYMGNVIDYLQKKGVVKESCVPYVAGSGKVLSCPTKCSSGEAFTKYFVGSYKVTNNDVTIKNYIYNEGPVSSYMNVYKDLYNYKSGIYKHVSGASMGGHEVTIIGWGSNYWICENSWGSTWGESGYFRIYFGECGIGLHSFSPVPKN